MEQDKKFQEISKDEEIQEAKGSKS